MDQPDISRDLISIFNLCNPISVKNEITSLTFVRANEIH